MTDRCSKCSAVVPSGETLCTPCRRSEIGFFDIITSPAPIIMTPKVAAKSVDYDSFLAAKQLSAPMAGIPDPPALSTRLFKWQSAIVRWALKRGKAALFLDTGLGKSLCEMEWCRVVSEHTGKPTLILAPLAVAQQFVREATKFGVHGVHYVATQRDIDDLEKGQVAGVARIYVTNYQKLHKFDTSIFGGVSCDESSIMKSQDGSTRNALIETFAQTPFKLCGTATPSPNDHTELGNTAEFLGIMTRVEMLSEFFVHDGATTQDWRLRGHALDAFWTWVASWACAVKKPSDLGFANEGYDLPPLVNHAHQIAVSRGDALARGSLFVEAAAGLQEQRAARRASLEKRVAKSAEIAKAYMAEGFQVLAWCELNDEQDALEKALGAQCYSIAGKDPDDVKELAVAGWLDGKRKAMISKASIFGFGLNFQQCSKIIFVGATNSYEAYYQAVRRCWRFGQDRQVDVHIVYSEAEGRVLENLERKQLAAENMGVEMSKRVSAILREELTKESTRMTDDYDPKVEMKVPDWLTA